MTLVHSPVVDLDATQTATGTTASGTTASGTTASGTTAPALDPRETMTRLPRLLQLPLTFLTGKPHVGQRPLRLSALHHLLACLRDMTIGVVISSFALTLGGWWLFGLLLGWAVTLHGMRNLRMMIYHQCAHLTMYPKSRWNPIIGRFASSLLVVQCFANYSSEHVADHHARHHMTLRDPTVQAFLLSLDLAPGMTRRQMWRRIVGKLLSPRFHLAFSIARVRSFASDASRGELATAISGYGLLAAIGVLTGAWPAILIVWLVPLFPLFQISNTLRLCVKHTFPQPDAGDRRGKEYFASLTNAIFLGEPAPDAPMHRRPLAWTRWSARMVFVHFPSRYLVLTGDTVCHDYHHRHPRTADWPAYIFARQQDVEAGHPGWPEYREVWGLKAAIDVVLDSLSTADAQEFDADRIRSVSKRSLFAAFDD